MRLYSILARGVDGVVAVKLTLGAAPVTVIAALPTVRPSAFKSVDEAGNTQSRTATGSASAFGCRAARSAATWPLDKNGEGISIPGNGACLLSRCGQGPRRVCSRMTTASRSESIGGLVTCEKR